MARSLAASLLLVAALEALIIVRSAAPSALGVDFREYRDQVASFLSGGSLYYPWQLTGPYDIVAGSVGVTGNVNPSLYPPLIVPLMAPFLVLPAVLWWAIPAAIVGYVLWRLRPSAWAWVGIGACLAWPWSLAPILYGNPVMWCAAAVAAGVLWRWPAVLVLVKPTLAPFALVGIRSRRWWVALAVLGAVSLTMLPAWVDWLHATINARGAGLTYSLAQFPLMAVPLIAWLGRRQPAQP